MDQSTSMHDLVTATLTELGVSAPTSLIQTLLLQDGYFVGYKFRYDGGHAILPAGRDKIAFFDDQGKLLKTVAVDADQGAAA